MASALPGMMLAVAVSASTSMRPATSANEMRRVGSFLTKISPAAASRPSMGASNPAEASSNSSRRTCSAACTTAVPVENVAVDPAVIGASGVPQVSANTASTCPESAPSTSAAICGSTVVAPSPTSMSPVTSLMAPDFSSRTSAEEGDPGPPR